MDIKRDYQACRDDGFGIAESIRTAVALWPDLSVREVIAALGSIGVNPGTVRIQYAKSRAIDAQMQL